MSKRQGLQRVDIRKCAKTGTDKPEEIERIYRKLAMASRTDPCIASLLQQSALTKDEFHEKLYQGSPDCLAVGTVFRNLPVTYRPAVLPISLFDALVTAATHQVHGTSLERDFVAIAALKDTLITDKLLIQDEFPVGPYIQAALTELMAFAASVDLKPKAKTDADIYSKIFVPFQSFIRRLSGVALHVDAFCGAERPSLRIAQSSWEMLEEIKMYMADKSWMEHEDLPKMLRYHIETYFTPDGKHWTHTLACKRCVFMLGSVINSTGACSARMGFFQLLPVIDSQVIIGFELLLFSDLTIPLADGAEVVADLKAYDAVLQALNVFGEIAAYMQETQADRHADHPLSTSVAVWLAYVPPKGVPREHSTSASARVDSASDSFSDARNVPLQAARDGLKHVISDFGTADARVVTRTSWKTHVVYSPKVHETFLGGAWIHRPVVVLIKEWLKEEFYDNGSKEKRCYDLMTRGTVPEVIAFTDSTVHHVTCFVLEAGIPLASSGDCIGQLKVVYPTALGLFDAVVRLLEELGAKGIIHGDIKPSNFVLLLRQSLALIDFSGSVILTEIPAPHASDILCVTERYRAPELLTTNVITSAIDVFGASKALQDFFTFCAAAETLPLRRLLWKMEKTSAAQRIQLVEIRAALNILKAKP